MTSALGRFWNRITRAPELRQEQPALVLGSEAAATDALLQEIVEGVVEGLGFRASMVSVVGAQNGQKILSVRAFDCDVTLTKVRWLDAGKRLEGTLLEIGQRIAGQPLIGNYVSLDEMENLGVRVIREGRPFARTDSLYPLFAKRVSKGTADKIQKLAKLQAFVTIPFRDSEGNLVGNLFAGTDRFEITDQEIRSLTAFSKMATIAIQNAQLLRESETLHREIRSRLEDVQRKNSQLQALRETISALLESTLSEDKVLQRIVEGVVEGFEFRAAMLSVVSHDEQGALILPVRAFSIHPDLRGAQILERGQKLIGQELIGSYVYVNEEVKKDNLGVRVILDEQDSGRTFELRDLWYPAATSSQCRWVQRGLGIHALATVPFWQVDKTGEKNLIGNLYVGTDREAITDDEIEVLRTFALQASNAIRNAEMYLNAQRIGAVASLTSNMAHRLNGIIGKVSAWVQQIGAKAEGDDLDVAFLKDRLQRISDSLVEAAAVVERVRERAKEDVKVSSVDVNQAVLLALTGVDIPSGISVERRLDRKLPEVMVVRQHLIEAFRILISNAVAAMGDSGRLTFVSRLIEDTIQVSVEDTGKGISDEVRGRLFTLGATTKKRGLGYGLWWAKTSLNWVEGDIEVESEPGKGSTFTITLPIPEQGAT
jgi:signal transduction histidine kinase